MGVVTIQHLVPGGWTAIDVAAASAGKLQVFDFSGNFWLPYTFWAGVIGGNSSPHLSHVRHQVWSSDCWLHWQKQSALALVSSGVAIFFQFALFLMVGVCCGPTTACPQRRSENLIESTPRSSSPECRTEFPGF